MLAAAGITVTACDQVRRPREEDSESDKPSESEPPCVVPASALSVDEPSERANRNRNCRQGDNSGNTTAQPEPREHTEQQANDSEPHAKKADGGPVVDWIPWWIDRSQ